MANFQYTEADLQHPLVDVLGGPHLTLESFGLNDRLYKKIERIDDELTDVDDDYLDTQAINRILNKYRCSVEQFKRLYALGHIWNNYHFNKNQTLLHFLQHYYKKARKFLRFEGEHVPPPSLNGNILHYLSSFDVDWLCSVGW